jgi:hypothetical protein
VYSMSVLSLADIIIIIQFGIPWLRHDEFVLTSGMICQHLPSLDELPYIVSVVFTTALAALGLAFAPTSPTILT